MIKNNNVKIMGVFESVLLLVIVITTSFAYFGSFNVNLNNNIAVNMSQTQSNNTVAAVENTAALTVSLTSGVAK